MAECWASFVIPNALQTDTLMAVQEEEEMMAEKPTCTLESGMVKGRRLKKADNDRALRFCQLQLCFGWAAASFVS